MSNQTAPAPVKAPRAKGARHLRSDFAAPSAQAMLARKSADLARLAARPEIHRVLHHCEHMQLVHDSFVRKIAGGSNVVTARELADQVQRLEESRRELFDLVQQHPLLAELPGMPTVRP